MTIKELMHVHSYEFYNEEILVIINEQDDKVLEITAKNYSSLKDEILDKKVLHWRQDGLVITIGAEQKGERSNAFIISEH